jgi:hypothetical protein
VEKTTEPGLININELKRLLVETIDAVIDYVDTVKSPDERKKAVKRIMNNIERAILDGDDS